MRPLFLVPLLVVLHGAPADAQESFERHCQTMLVEVAGAGDACLAAVQAARSAQPSLGVLIAGGNPSLGTTGAAGLRLGVAPRVSAGAKLTVAAVRLPDILAQQAPGQADSLAGRFGVPAPALGGDLSVAVTKGFDVSPGLGGIGAVSLLGSATYLPFRLLGVEGFEGPDVALGGGLRVQLVQESFIAPGAAISLTYRRLGNLSFGDVCPGGAVPIAVEPPGQSRTEVSGCTGAGDAGEFRFDLVDWSGRLFAGKRWLGLGVIAGLGFDNFRSDVDFGFRGGAPTPGSTATPVFRVSDEWLSARRWSAFANLSYSLLVTTLALEAGWQQGTPIVRGFDDLGSDFDPRAGTWFGSLGGRISL